MPEHHRETPSDLHNLDEGHSQIYLITVLGHPRAGHAHARTLVMRARALGLTVDHDHRTLVRTHLLTLRGPAKTQRKFLKGWERYVRAQQRGDTAASMRARRREHLTWIRQLRDKLGAE